MMDRVRFAYLQCSCCDPAHIARVSLDTNEDPPELAMTLHLNMWLPWWKRVVVAFKYLFKKTPVDHRWSSYPYDTVLLDEKGITTLSSMLIHRRLIMKVRKQRKLKGK